MMKFLLGLAVFAVSISSFSQRQEEGFNEFKSQTIFRLDHEVRFLTNQTCADTLVLNVSSGDEGVSFMLEAENDINFSVSEKKIGKGAETRVINEYSRAFIEYPNELFSYDSRGLISSNVFPIIYKLETKVSRKEKSLLTFGISGVASPVYVPSVIHPDEDTKIVLNREWKSKKTSAELECYYSYAN